MVKVEHSLQSKIAALELRIEELLQEKSDLINESNSFESEIKRLKDVCLNLQTEMTATKMTNWCLNDPEELYQIEQGINERKMLKNEIERKEKVIRKLQSNIKTYRNEIDFYKGSFNMVREVINKRTMVIHPWATKEVCDKQCDNNNKLVDDIGGFGMFEPSPTPSHDCYCKYE